jgi:hypothetical protein
VPKYDAFGREIGEDTLQGLGGSPSPAPVESAWETRTEADEATWQAAEQVEVARRRAADDAADVQAERTEDARQEAPARRATPPRPTPAHRARRPAQRRPLPGRGRRASAGTPSIGVRKRSAGRGCLIAFVVLLAILGGLTAAIVGLVNSVDVETGGSSGGTKIIPEPSSRSPRRRASAPARSSARTASPPR